MLPATSSVSQRAGVPDVEQQPRAPSPSGLPRRVWVVTAPDVVRFKHLRKRLGAVDALKDVSFAVQEREIVALLGDNGTGKSTVAKCIAGLHQADSGVIEVGGSPVVIRTPSEARSLGISVVFQDLAMFDNLPVVENFLAGVELRSPEWLGGAARLRKKEMLTQARETLERLEVHVSDTAGSKRPFPVSCDRLPGAGPRSTAHRPRKSRLEIAAIPLASRSITTRTLCSHC